MRWFVNSVLKPIPFILFLYLKGLAFLIAHPVQFFDFVREWERFQHSIREKDEAVAAGFADLSRAERRALDREVNRKVGKQISKGNA